MQFQVVDDNSGAARALDFGDMRPIQTEYHKK
jgi:hypothetical protein